MARAIEKAKIFESRKKNTPRNEFIRITFVSHCREQAETGKVLATAISPKTETEMTAIKAGRDEQLPEVWWEHVKSFTT